MIKTGSILKRGGKEWQSGNAVVDRQNDNKYPMFGVVEKPKGGDDEAARTKWNILQSHFSLDIMRTR